MKITSIFSDLVKTINSHRKITAAFLASLAIPLWLAPVGFGGNRHVPVIGWGETLVDNYSLGLMRRAQDAYIACCAIDSAVSMAATLQANAGVMGVSGSVSPGAALSPAQDTIKELSGYFYGIVLLTMIEKQSMGMFTWLCCKVFLPVALLCYACRLFFGPRMIKAGQTAAMICKAALCVWLFLPITAALAGIVNAAYINPRYETHVDRLKKEICAVFPTAGDALKKGANLREVVAAALVNAGESGFIAKAKDFASKIKKTLASPDDILNLLLLLFSQLVITAHILPLLILALFFGLFRIVMRP